MVCGLVQRSQNVIAGLAPYIERPAKCHATLSAQPGSGHRPRRAPRTCTWSSPSTPLTHSLTHIQHIPLLPPLACPGSQRAPCLALPSPPPLARGMTNPTAHSTSSSCSHSTTAPRTSTRRNNGSTPPSARLSTPARLKDDRTRQSSSSRTPASSRRTTTPSTTRASGRPRLRTPLGRLA